MKKKTKRILLISIAAAVLAIAAVLIYVFAVYLPDKKEEQAWVEAVQNYYNTKVEQYAIENEQYADYEVDVAFLGDSLTDGYDLKSYYPQYVTANRGIGGDTTHGLENRLDVSVLQLKPKVAVMLIGANNFHTMFENYERILQSFKENLPDTKVVLLSLTSMGDSWAKNNQLAAFNNVKIKALAEKYGFSYVDLYTPLLDLDTNEIRPEYTTDGGHFTAEGYVVLTNTITPVLKELLGY